MTKTEWVLCILTAVFVIGGIMVSGGTSTEVGVPSHHTVEPGETYWTIARKYWPNDHAGERAFVLRELNGIEPGHLQPGDVVHLREAE